MQSVSIVLLAAVRSCWPAWPTPRIFPKKRVTYNICFNPGGESDITARLQEQTLKKYLGADVSIQYKIGGGGALCWAELVKTAPDGYTIAGHNLPHTILQPMEMGDAGYKTFDLKQVYMFESHPERPDGPEGQPLQHPEGIRRVREDQARRRRSRSAGAPPRPRTTWGSPC